jgi:hypothetical protein
VLDHQDHGPAEIRVREHRRGDEQAAGQALGGHFVHVPIITGV